MTTADNGRRPEPLMTYDEAAEYLRLSPGTLRNKVSEGTIPFVKPGGSVRFRRAELDRWMEAEAGREPAPHAESA